MPRNSLPHLMQYLSKVKAFHLFLVLGISSSFLTMHHSCYIKQQTCESLKMGLENMYASVPDTTANIHKLGGPEISQFGFNRV